MTQYFRLDVDAVDEALFLIALIKNKSHRLAKLSRLLYCQQHHYIYRDEIRKRILDES